MTGPLMGLIAAWAVLRLTGFRRGWPWRIGELVEGPPWDPERRDHGLGARPRTERGDRDGLHRSLPTTIDLLLVATSAGHPIHSAIEVVCRFDDGPVGKALAEAWTGYLAGASLAERLRLLPVSHGEVLRPLVDTLVMGLSSGAPLEPALHRLAERQRQRVRRRTEERVRRLPLLLLGPLILFVLPSFVLLTIVPVVVVTARGIAP